MCVDLKERCVISIVLSVRTFNFTSTRGCLQVINDVE